MKTEQVALAKRPDGIPDDDVFRYETVDVVRPQDNEILLEPLYISVDPYMRGRMNDSESYVAPFELDKPIISHIVARVIESKDSDIVEDDIVLGRLPWRKKITVNSAEVTKVTNHDIPIYLYLSALGMPGQTAYHGLLKIGKPQPGETVVVSAASGAVGSVVGQIAKIKGARVVGIAGGKEKTTYIKNELGFDEAVDYKDSNFAQNLAKVLPDGVDVYFENVGGEIGDEVFKHLNKFARIPVCGAISGYNDNDISFGPRIHPTLIKTQALMQGFIVGNYADDFPQASKQLAQWVEENKIITKTSIMDGFENLPHAFRNLFSGDNFGKQVVNVEDDI